MAQQREVALTDGSDRQIVDVLAKHWLDELTGAHQTPIPVDAANWRKYLTNRPKAVREIVDYFSSEIGRSDLRILAQDQDSAVGRERLFVATLMWGRGKKNARMLPGIRDCLTNPALKHTLRVSRDLIGEGLPGDAYVAWEKASLPGLGEAFFTKWFFASGLSVEDGRLLKPLVLDSRVWKSLESLGWSSQRASGFRYRSHPSAGYCAYLRAARDWAVSLSTEHHPVSAEGIEMFLFGHNGRLTK